MNEWKTLTRTALICLIFEICYLVCSTHIYLLNRPDQLYIFSHPLGNELLFFAFVLILYGFFMAAGGCLFKAVNRLFHLKLNIDIAAAAGWVFLAVGVRLNWDVLPAGCTVWSPRGLGATTGAMLLAIAVYLVAAGLKRRYQIAARGRTLAIILPALLLFWGFMSYERREPPADREWPDVYVIVLDTVRQDVLTPYNHSLPTTPFLQTLSESAVVYRNAYTVAPWTLPSHASMFTSKYTTEHGAVSGDPTMDDSPDWVPLPEILRQHGYGTYALSANPVVALNIHNTAGFQEYYTVGNVRENFVLLRLIYYIFGLDHDDMSARKTIRLAANLLDYKNRPRFVFINWIEAHKPYVSPAAYQEKWLGRVPAADEYLVRADRIRYDDSGMLRFSDSDRDFFYRRYLASVNYLDDCLRRFFSVLDRDPQRARNSLIIIVSDHGENLGEHNLWGHIGSLHETILRIPLIILYPRRGITGVEEKRVTTLDIAPTVLAQLGIAAGPDFHGRDLRADPEPGMVYAEFFSPEQFFNPQFNRAKPHPGRYRGYPQEQYALLWNNSKYIYGMHPEQYWLYDLAADPQEMNNRVIESRAAAGEVRDKIDAVRKSRVVHENFTKYSSNQDVYNTLQGLGYLR